MWTNGFVKVQVIKQVMTEGDGGMIYRNHKKDIFIKPSQIESYEPAFVVDSGMEGAVAEVGNYTLVITKSGNAFYADMSVKDFEKKMNDYEQELYR